MAPSDEDGSESYEEGSEEEEEEYSEEEEASDLSADESEEEYLLDHYDEDNLPEYACRYCGIHDPASVAKCVESNKWFCNGTASHLVHHLVKTRNHQVQLHPNSPLGDTVLECYNCASKNAFVLGFVPSSATSVVVLLCRVCVETVPALKDMDWDLSQWHPLIQDRKFLPWLVSVPSDKLVLRAREVTPAQMNKLEELWVKEPNAKFRDLERPDVEQMDELAPTLLEL